MTQADRIRKYAAERYIEPARREGKRCVTVLVRDVLSGMNSEYGEAPDRTAIAGALRSQQFCDDNNLRLVCGEGYAERRYEILSRKTPAPDSFGDLTPESSTSPGSASEDESKENILAKLHEYVGELTQDEFENLVRAYVKAKGFSNVEVTLALKMKP